MKNIIRIAVCTALALVPASARAQQLFEEFGTYVLGLPAASVVNPSDVFYLNQGGVSKTVTGAVISASATLPPIGAGQILANYTSSTTQPTGVNWMAAGNSCPGSQLTPYQMFVNAAAAPTNTLLTVYDGSQCVSWATLNSVSHVLNLTANGAALTPAANGVGLVVTQTATNTVPVNINFNSFIISSDTSQSLFSNQVYAQWNHGGSTVKGSRSPFFSWIIQTAPDTGAGVTSDAGAAFVAQTNTGQTGGTYFGLNTIVRGTGAAQNFFSIEGDIMTDASYTGQYSAAFAAANFEAARGTLLDAAFMVYSGGLIPAAGGGGPWGPGIGFHCGLCFSEPGSSLPPIDTGGTLVGSFWANITPPTVALGVDFGDGTTTGFNFGTAAFRSPGFKVGPTGKVVAAGATDRSNVMDIGPDTGTNVVRINGGTGGSGGSVVSFAAGGTQLSDIGFPSVMFGGAFDGSLGVFGFNGVRFFAGTGANTFDFQVGPNTTRVLDYNITNTGKWTFGAAIIDPSGSIAVTSLTTTGTGTPILASSANTSAANFVQVLNTGTSSTAGTNALFRAGLGGTNNIQFGVLGGASLIGAFFMEAGITKFEVSLNGTNILDYNILTANLWTFSRAVSHTWGSDNPLVFGPNATNVKYNSISFNNALSNTGNIGFTGGATSVPDTNLYAQVPTGGGFQLQVNGLGVMTANATGLLTAGALFTNGSTAIQTGTTYSMTATDSAITFNSSGNATITLAAATNAGRWLTIKQIAAFTVVSATSNVVPQGSTTAGTAILSGAGKWAILQSNGTNWVIMASN